MTDDRLTRAATLVAACDDCASQVHVRQDREANTLTVEVEHSATCPAWPHAQREVALHVPGKGHPGPSRHDPKGTS